MPDLDQNSKLALTGTLLGVFDAAHPFFDQWCQKSDWARLKDARGRHLVYTSDGTPVGEATDDRTNDRIMTASRLGWTNAARHVAVYTLGQAFAAEAATRALGFRLPLRAHLLSALVNGSTHLVIDRRFTLRALADTKLFGKTGYIEHCSIVRKIDAKEAEDTGPGTALFELDQALHRVIGAAAAVVTAAVAVRWARK